MTERGSDKASPRVDDELVRETEPLERGAPAPARAEEHRQMEAPAEGEPAPDARPERGAGQDSSAARAELARHLRPSVFPADRQELVATARDENAPDEVIRALERLPADRRFDTPQDVWEALGES
jgi:hypothetical protein